MQNFLKTLSAIIFSALLTSNLYAEPNIFSPEDFGPTICVGCCDENGNQLPSDPVCGCDPVDSCGVCGGDGSSCGCELFDCAGNSFPDPLPYCHLDVNGDKKIDRSDVEAVNAYLNSNGGETPVTESNKHYNVSKTDNYITPLDSLLVINFLGKDIPGITKVDSCGVCGGPGKNVCGTCPNDLNYIEPIGPNGICGCPNSPQFIGPYNFECKICTKLSKDSCGRCPGEDQYSNPLCGPSCPSGEFDNGCGCGAPPPSGCDNQCGSTATLGCDGICNSGKTVDICNICDGDGTSCQEECKFYNVDFLQVGFGSKVAFGDGESLSCVQNLLNKYHLNSNLTVAGDMNDEQLFYNFAVSLGGVAKTGPAYKTFARRIKSLSGTSYLMDENCNPIRKSAENISKICGDLSIRYSPSPISLLFDVERELFTDSKIVSFRLNPYKDPEFVMWRASDKAPLLVYDPERSGKITSGTQLFGTWTFGGTDHLASLEEGIFVESKGWANGFEPLKTLDRNSDGVLTGEELEKLSLWFDSNRDAISQVGEVRPLTDSGIHELKLGKIEKDPKLTDLYVKNAFARQFDGKSITGDMVDWFTRSYATPTEALAYESFRMFEGQETHQTESSNELPTTATDIDHLKEMSLDNFSGIYLWKFKGDVPESIKGLNDNGIISITDEDGKLSGHLYVEIPFAHVKTKKQYRTLMVKKFDAQKFIRENDKKVGIRFVLNDENGMTTTEIFKDNTGENLVGSTTNKFVPKGGLPTNLSYEWLATPWEKK